MLALDDERWLQMNGGYKARFDPRPLLRRLESDKNTGPVWHALWDELHHQGDVGEASFAAVPHLVRLCIDRGEFDWNVYALTAVIELARDKNGNPDVPQWTRDSYFRAIRELAEVGCREILNASDPDHVRAILSVLAIERKLPSHARFLIAYAEDELLQLESVET